MKVSPWWIAAFLLLPFAVYIALTAGTVFLLPKEWEEIERGMTAEEVRRLIPGVIVEIQFNPSQEDQHIVSKTVGLREWALFVRYENGKVAGLQRVVVDPHHRWFKGIDWIVIRE